MLGEGKLSPAFMMSYPGFAPLIRVKHKRRCVHLPVVSQPQSFEKGI